MTDKEQKALITDIVGFVGASHERYYSHPFPSTISVKKMADSLKSCEMMIIPLQAVGTWIPYREIHIEFEKMADAGAEYYNIKVDFYSEKNKQLELLKTAERDFYLADYTKENQ